MQPWSHLRFTLLGLIALLWTLPYGRAASADPVCDDDGVLNVLSINLFALEIEHRDERLAIIADYVVSHDVDIIFLQEVVGGLLAGTRSSARDLQRILQEDVEFELRSLPEFTLPGLLTVGNATLSRCDIQFSVVKNLTPQPDVEIGGESISVFRNVLCARIDVPGWGSKVNACNTHLCSGCDADERGDQLTEALNFLGQVRSFLPGPTIWAGDFNLDPQRDDHDGVDHRYNPTDPGPETSQYYSIAGPDASFIDAYFEGQPQPLELIELCPEPRGPDYEHCTVNVSGLGGGNARRIDYVFAGKGDFDVSFSQVVFNPGPDAPFPNPDPLPPGQDEPTVSDHAGVLVGFTLPSAGVASLGQ